MLAETTEHAARHTGAGLVTCAAAIVAAMVPPFLMMGQDQRASEHDTLTAAYADLFTLNDLLLSAIARRSAATKALHEADPQDAELLQARFAAQDNAMREHTTLLTEFRKAHMKAQILERSETRQDHLDALDRSVQSLQHKLKEQHDTRIYKDLTDDAEAERATSRTIKERIADHLLADSKKGRSK